MFGDLRYGQRKREGLKTCPAEFIQLPEEEPVTLRCVFQLLDLCDSVKDDALRVISAFNIPDTSLHAPIAGITNAKAAWAFYPAPLQPEPGEGARSQRRKLEAKL